jgi:hypothetical protein
MSRLAIVIGVGVLALSACSTAQPRVADATPSITCAKGSDCDMKWSRAISWVASNSSYKVQTQTDSIIQTTGPSANDPSPGFTVIKLAKGPSIYEITLKGGCENVIGCVPTIADERAKFAAFVLSNQ